MTGVELRGIYDGVCYWWCPMCDRRVHRFGRHDPVRAKVASWCECFNVVIEDRP